MRRARDKAGKDVETLPKTQKLQAAMFDAAVGDDTVPVRHSDGGYVWFDVLEIEPSRQLKFDEVKERVQKAWLASEDKKIASEFAAKLVKEIENGKDFAEVAKSVNAEVVSPDAFGRGAEVEDIPVVYANRLFSVKTGAATSGLAKDNKRWLVAKVKAHLPAAKEGPAYDAYKTKLQNELQTEITNDLVTQYLEGAKRKFGVQENNQVFETLKTTL